MSTLGIVGGIGPESTIDYYRSIVASYREKNPTGAYPAMLINSINFEAMLELITARDHVGLAAMIADAVQRLGQAGADFALIASNTPHVVFEEISRQSSIPLISIVEVTAHAARQAGYRKLCLFGTSFTMNGGFYQTACTKEGLTVVTPNEQEQDYIHQKYLSELVQGIFQSETRDRLLEITGAVKARHDVDAIILGGTELPLILREADGDIPFVDTARIHVNAAVTRLLANDV